MERSPKLAQAVETFRLACNATVEALQKSTTQMIAAAKALVALCDECHAQQALPAPEVQKLPSLEDVRAVLAEKSRGGHTEAIREIILRHGSNRLTEVAPGNYAAILEEVGNLQ
jgi:hypothetical protein